MVLDEGVNAGPVGDDTDDGCPHGRVVRLLIVDCELERVVSDPSVVNATVPALGDVELTLPFNKGRGLRSLLRPGGSAPE
ncbi:MAG: hypothetical protein NVS3B1_14790 [Marmoricola sp.]